MDNETFRVWRRVWRRRHFRRQADAATAYGVAEMTIRNYERDRRYDKGAAVTIPPTVAAACALVDLGYEIGYPPRRGSNGLQRDD